MNTLQKIVESLYTEDDYVISSIERFTDKDVLLVFTDGSSVQVSKKDELFVISAVNQYNDDRNMSEEFVLDVEGYKNEEMRSDEIEEIIKEFKESKKKKKKKKKLL
jgi:hypothetical protein